MEEHQTTQFDKDMSNYNKVLYNGECWATITTATAASSAYSVNEQYYNIPINPLSKTTSDSGIWLIISLAHVLITKLMKAPIFEPMYENCRWINQNMQELVTPMSVWAWRSAAAAEGLLCDTMWQQSDTAANLCCWYLVTSREEGTVFVSGFYSRNDLPGLCVHLRCDVKLTQWIRQWWGSSVVHVVNTEWHHLLAWDDNRCLCILQMHLQLLANNKGIYEFHCWWLDTCRVPLFLSCEQ